MSVEQESKGYSPVCIVLESQAEFQALRSLLGNQTYRSEEEAFRNRDLPTPFTPYHEALDKLFDRLCDIEG
jgi:hypothetical protein